MSDADLTPLDFALLGHPDGYDHLGELIVHSRPDYDRSKLEKYQATLTKFFEWSPSYASKTPLVACGPNGERREGRLVIATFMPDALNSPRSMMTAYKKTYAGVALARDRGAKIVGLGGFTSIVGGAQGEKLANELGVATTSGNTLTAGLALAQMDALLSRLGWTLAGKTVAIIGASGDIGRACTFALAGRAAKTLVIARNRAKLEALRAELPEALDVRVSTDLADALQAEVILAATSASEPILSEAALKPGTLVFDISYPKNMAYSETPRGDVLVISAGLADVPFDFDIQYYTRLPTRTMLFGCFTETMVLALANRYESFSIGQGQITLEKMAEIVTLAGQFGVKPAPFYRGDVAIDDGVIEGFLRSVQA